MRCPLDINTGKLTKTLRVAALEQGVTGYGATPASGPTMGAQLANWMASRMGLVTSGE